MNGKEPMKSKPCFNSKPPVTTVHNEVNNTPVQPNAITNSVVAKVPVVLAETTVQIDLDSMIEFPENVLEIKKIKKNLKITQCRLLLPTSKLFIKGFVRKNIQYAAPKCGDKYAVSSDIKSLTVDVPFSAITELTFITQPQFQATVPEQTFQYFSSQSLPQGFSPKDQLMSNDFTEYNQINQEVFNELPYCELLSSKFIELDEVLDRKMGEVKNDKDHRIEAPFEEGTFRNIEEKMVIELTLKVLQKQQVQLNHNGQNGQNSGNGGNCDNEW